MAQPPGRGALLAGRPRSSVRGATGKAGHSVVAATLFRKAVMAKTLEQILGFPNLIPLVGRLAAPWPLEKLTDELLARTVTLADPLACAIVRRWGSYPLEPAHPAALRDRLCELGMDGDALVKRAAPEPPFPAEWFRRLPRRARQRTLRAWRGCLFLHFRLEDAP